jgi:D-sedoheptulose 7-phosphate isomerase
MTDVRTHIAEHAATIAKLDALSPDIEVFAHLIYTAVCKQGTIYWCGNGGSAGDAQHLSAELMGRYVSERRGLRSFALTTDSSLLTAVANDYHFDRIFARQIETVARAGDVVVIISTSGNSSNILAAAVAARASGATVVGMSGASGGQLRAHCDLCLCVPSSVTARIQECHGLIGHIVCALIDAWVAAETKE